MILFLDMIGVVNLAAKSIKSCLVKLQLRVAVSNARPCFCYFKEIVLECCLPSAGLSTVHVLA